MRGSGSGSTSCRGYDLEIRHIPGKRNPADTLSRQDKKDALGRKTAVHNANADLVRELRVPQMRMMRPSRKL